MVSACTSALGRQTLTYRTWSESIRALFFFPHQIKCRSEWGNSSNNDIWSGCAGWPGHPETGVAGGCEWNWTWILRKGSEGWAVRRLSLYRDILRSLIWSWVICCLTSSIQNHVHLFCTTIFNLHEICFKNMFKNEFTMWHAQAICSHGRGAKPNFLLCKLGCSLVQVF